MLPLRRQVVTLALGLVAAGGLRAAEWTLPPITGELEGDFKALKFEAMPGLHWKLTVRDADAGRKIVGVALDGPGTKLRGELNVDGAGDGTWRIVEGELQLPAWAGMILPRLGPEFAPATIEGTLLFRGDGTLRQKAVAGNVTLELRAGAVRGAVSGWSVDGVTLQGTLGGTPGQVNQGKLTLGFREFAVAGVTAREGAAEFSLDEQGGVNVARVVFGLLDGRVELTPFQFKLAEPRVRTKVRFTNVELSRLATLLPPVLADARGPIGGEMELSWSGGANFALSNGTLHPEPAAPASILLTPSPGLLTSRLPAGMRERIDVLPAWFGPVRKLFSPKNPAYETLRAIEMGETRLEVHTLEVEVQPNGDVNGRTARVVVMASPAAAASVVDAVRFEINVTGPLADVLRLGLEGRFKVHSP